MAASPLRRWLRRQPHPARLRVDGRDVAVATGAQCWLVTEESVLALNPSRIEAIDPNGVCLRAMTLDNDGSDEGEGDDDVPTNGSDVVLLARLIGEAHDAGARRHAEAYAKSFDKLVELVNILANRLGGLETAWQKAMHQTANAQANAIATAAAAEAAASTDPAGQAIAAMLAQGLMNGGAKNGGPAKAKKGDGP